MRIRALLVILLGIFAAPSFSQSDRELDCHGWCYTPYGAIICWASTIHGSHEELNRCSNYAYDSNAGTVRRGGGVCERQWSEGGNPNTNTDDEYGGVECDTGVWTPEDRTCFVYGQFRCGSTMRGLAEHCDGQASVPLADIQRGSAHCSSDIAGQSWSCSCGGEQLYCAHW